MIEYCGEVLPTHMFEKRSLEYSEAGSKHFYFMSLNSNEYIDATRKGNISRFLNHSCDPNCFLQKWIVGNRVLIGIFTKKSVKSGDELTFDYQFERYGYTIDNILGVKLKYVIVGPIFVLVTLEKIRKMLALDHSISWICFLMKKKMNYQRLEF